MIDERYLYEIHPHRPIKNLIPGRAIIKPCSMKLTKSEVLTCMQGGPVFRLFHGKTAIRVVGSNLDQLHVAKYEEYEKLANASNQTKNDENITRATEGVAEEPKIEAPTTPIVEEKPVEPETEKITEPEYIPVPVEPGPVIIEEKEVKEEEPVPVPVEPGPVIIEEEDTEEEVVEESTESLEDASVEDVVGVGAPQPANNSVSVNVGNHKNNPYHKKNRH